MKDGTLIVLWLVALLAVAGGYYGFVYMTNDTTEGDSQ